MENNLKNTAVVGVVMAMKEELGLVEKALGQKVCCEDTLFKKPVLYFKNFGKDIYVAFSGCGEIGAAACTQALIDRYKVDYILNVGYVGSLRDYFGAGSVVAVSKRCITITTYRDCNLKIRRVFIRSWLRLLFLVRKDLLTFLRARTLKAQR